MVGVPLRASDHSKKEIRKVLEELTDAGWTIHADGHWGKLYCPCASRCTTIPVSSTPKNDVNHARRIARLAARCPLPEGSPQRSLTGNRRD